MRSRHRFGLGGQFLRSDLYPQISTEPLQVYTDGSFDKESGQGGWAFVVMDNGVKIHEVCGRQTGTSNNSFEVLAAVRAVEWIESTTADREVVLWTDSFHVMDGCHRWRKIWRTNGWKRIVSNAHARRRSIPDADLWQQLDALLESNSHVQLKWCKGHAETLGNRRADMLARTVSTEHTRVVTR